MPTYNNVAWAIDLLLAVGIALAVYSMLSASLRRLLDNVVALPEGTAFYLRGLSLVLVCVALSKVIVGVHQKPDAHFMEYVWAVAGDLSGVFSNLFVVLLVYLGLITVLVAVLKPKNGK